MLDPVPLAGAGRQMADGDAQTEFIGQRLQFALPQAYPSAVTAAAIGGDQQATGLRIAGATHAVPPAADRIDGETGSIVVDADTHPPRVGLSLRTQFAAAILEVANKLLLLRVNRDHRLTRRQRITRLGIDIAELRVTVGMVAAFPGLAIGLQAVAEFA